MYFTIQENDKNKVFWTPYFFETDWCPRGILSSYIEIIEYVSHFEKKQLMNK